MASFPDRVCWDSCSWIAYIQQEKTVENGIDRFTRCKSVLEQARLGKMEIVCSAFCLVEVCKNKDVKDINPQILSDFFESDYILLVNLDRQVGDLARKLMMMGLPGLKPADACHLATAAFTPGVRELHSFDEKLLNLSNQVTRPDGAVLKISFPDVSAPPPPLLAVESS